MICKKVVQTIPHKICRKDSRKEGESVVAVIMELEGGRIRIHDDMMVKTKEENDRIVENVSRIMINAAYRRMKEEQEKREETA